MTKTVLVTGGAGFIGSHFIRYLLGRHDDVEVINVDKLTYSANPANLAEVADHPRYRFVRLDLADEGAVRRLFRQHRVDEVVHFAAESHVDRSIRKTEPFIRSNIVGTHRLLEAVREAGVERLIHVSTDEVYGSIPRGQADEQTRLSPGNPYSASKAASDFLCLAYVNTYELPVVITRCTNNYGPYQHPEKFIPRMILSALQNRPLPIYGGGRQERDWIHVRDHCAALDRVRQGGRIGEIYHIGVEQPRTNLEVAERILDVLGRPRSLIRHVANRPGHDVRYALDASKIRTELGWEPEVSFDRGLRETVEWYRRRRDWWEKAFSQLYREMPERGDGG